MRSPEALRANDNNVENDGAELRKPEDEIDQNCERYFGHKRDDLAREFQLVGLIDGYKRWGVKGENVEIHKKILEAAENDDIVSIEREQNPDGTVRQMTAKLRDGSVLSEERSYDRKEPSFNYEQAMSYIQDGIITDEEADDVARVFGVLMGEELPEDVDVQELRRNVGAAKEKILAHYNKIYQNELFSDDGNDRDGLKHEVLDDGTRVVCLEGVDFKILAHVRNAMFSAQGEKSAEDLNVSDPKEEWSNPRAGADYIPRGLSTSLISSKKISIYRRSEIIFGFCDIEDNSIVSMSEEDIGSATNAHSRYGIVGSHGNERMMTPDELIEKTDVEGAMSSFNEVVLDRLAGGKLIMPSCLIVFGNDAGKITDLQRRYAHSFDIPVYLIDDTKYGGVRALGGHK